MLRNFFGFRVPLQGHDAFDDGHFFIYVNYRLTGWHHHLVGKAYVLALLRCPLLGGGV